MTDPLLSVNELTVSFKTQKKLLQAVRGTTFAVYPHEILAIVGESGCGKSATAKAILQLLPPHSSQCSGSVIYEGKDLLSLDEPAMRKVRGKEISMIFQDPMSSLNPTMKIGDQILESYLLHNPHATRREAEIYALKLLEMVGIPEPAKRIDAYPHTLSGGMRQRVMIAIALVAKPKLIIADEPTTALDVTIQAQILELMHTIKEKTQTSFILITHDLSVVAGYADRVLVMYGGRVVESGGVEQIFKRPHHPYTRGLLNSIPRLDMSRVNLLQSIDGHPPLLTEIVTGCAFSPRCSQSLSLCSKQLPLMEEVAENHFCSCFNKIKVPFKKAPPSENSRGVIATEEPFVQVRNLKKYYTQGTQTIKAIDDASFNIYPGEILGLVGESGCGKSTVAKALLQLSPPTDGTILFDGKEIQDIKNFRKEIGMVFQDPNASLNPRMTTKDIIAEPLEIHQVLHGDAKTKRIEELLKLVGLPPDSMGRFPHEFSGGQKQRIAIARALAVNPRFIICDEPLSSLDVSIQAQIINLLLSLQKELGLTYLFIAHDLRVVKFISTRIAVMYLGTIVEIAPADELYSNPLHPYTQALISSIPIPDPKIEKQREKIVLHGEIPSAFNPPKGCPFVTRCPYAMDICKEVRPPLKDYGNGKQAACHLLEREEVPSNQEVLLHLSQSGRSPL